MHETAHISVHIARKPSEVYEYASNPINLPLWAAGLARSEVKKAGEWWMMTAPFGLRLESGVIVHNPMRVVPHEDGSEFVFTLFRRPEMTDEQFKNDKAAITKDLQTLKKILESAPPKNTL